MTFTHGELLADTQRWYRVRAKNSVGESGWSDGDTGDDQFQRGSRGN